MSSLSNEGAVQFRQHPLFVQLSPERLLSLTAQCTEQTVPRGKIMRRRGERCCGIYIVASGRLKLSLESRRGEEQVISLLGPGGHFGEPLVYSGLPCLSTVEALKDSVLVCVPREAILEEIDRNSKFARQVIESLSRRLYQRTREIEAYTLHTGTERLVSYLLSEQPARIVNGARHVVLPASKGLIASRLNVTQEHLSRILRELVAKQLIVVSGAHVVIPDVNRLLSDVA